jgi:hypothetical protein
MKIKLNRLDFAKILAFLTFWLKKLFIGLNLSLSNFYCNLILSNKNFNQHSKKFHIF